MTCNAWLTAGLAGSVYSALIQQWALTYPRWSIASFLSRRPGFSSSVLRVRSLVVNVTFGRLDPAAFPCQLSFYHCSILVCLEDWYSTTEAALQMESRAQLLQLYSDTCLMFRVLVLRDAKHTVQIADKILVSSKTKFVV